MASESKSNAFLASQTPLATAPMTASQASTNTYAAVTESQLDVTGRNLVNYAVKNTGANTMTAKMQGRVRNSAGGASDWIDLASPAPADVAAGATVEFSKSNPPYSDVRMAVVSKVADTPGAAMIHGIAKKV